MTWKRCNKHLTDSSLLGEKSFGLLFQLNMFWLLFGEEAVCFFCWRVLILVFSGEQVRKAYDSGWILESWTCHSLLQKNMLYGLWHCELLCNHNFHPCPITSSEFSNSKFNHGPFRLTSSPP